jgi:hypothetical protein
MPLQAKREAEVSPVSPKPLLSTKTPAVPLGGSLFSRVVYHLSIMKLDHAWEE